MTTHSDVDEDGEKNADPNWDVVRIETDNAPPRANPTPQLGLRQHHKGLPFLFAFCFFFNAASRGRGWQVKLDSQPRHQTRDLLDRLESK